MINFELLQQATLEGLYKFRPTDPFDQEHWQDVVYMDEQVYASLKGWTDEVIPYDGPELK